LGVFVLSDWSARPRFAPPRDVSADIAARER
jgi:hypothetical protein